MKLCNYIPVVDLGSSTLCDINV